MNLCDCPKCIGFKLVQGTEKKECDCGCRPDHCQCGCLSRPAPSVCHCGCKYTLDGQPCRCLCHAEKAKPSGEVEDKIEEIVWGQWSPKRPSETVQWVRDALDTKLRELVAMVRKGK